ncbi:MAG TPA: formyltransferase family protein [Gaiellaceae bacterium]
MKVVVLTRNPRGIASRFLARGNVDVAAVILDESRGTTIRRKLRKLRRAGPTAAPVGFVLRRAYASAAAAPSLEELGVPIVRVSTLNGPQARAALAGADVAVSLENSLISAATFTIPAHGAINVHHGAVPEYRGGPPVFWELADGRDTVGFTVHRIDAGIDTGPVLAEGAVPIRRRRSLPETLAATIPPLYDASLDALEGVLAGDLEGRPQRPGGALRTTPALRDYLRVRRSLRH